jgi:hypothetical protein
MDLGPLAIVFEFCREGCVSDSGVDFV